MILSRKVPSNKYPCFSRWNYTAPTQSMIATIFKNVGWFEKQGYLFDGTLRDNIIMGRQELSHVDLEKVLKIVGLFDFVQTQPLGFDTEVSSKNKSLSFQQQELILIARAIIQKPEIIILSLYGLSLEENEIQTLLSKIEREYAQSTIIIGSNIQYKMNWNQEKIN
jgi:ABC-type multidrug transport system fused ATPase/permease subunit